MPGSMSRLLGLFDTFVHVSDFRVKRALSFLGMKACTTVQYPRSGIKEKVMADGFWRHVERGGWEPNCIRHMSSVVSEGQTILDVGAWIGPYTLLFSKLVGATGRVLAFEPDPDAFRTLRCNVEKNTLSNVHLEPLCLTDSIGKANLKSRRFGEGLSSLVRAQLSRANPTEIVVETTTIDSYCDEKRIRPDGIKIDVEGAERLVLDGSWNVIETYAPWVLLEFHGYLMSEEDMIVNWHEIVRRAKKVTFIDGAATGYCYGTEVDSMPDCEYFHVFIRY